MKCYRSNFKHGFTLIEVSIVIAVIAVIISVSIPVFSNIISNARISNDKMTVKNINTVLSVNQHQRDTSANVISAMHLIVNEGYSASDLEFSDDGCHLVYNSSTAMMVLYDDEFNSILYGDEADSDDLCVIGLKCIESAFSAGITNFCLYSTESTVVIETSYEINIILYTKATMLTINAVNACIYNYGKDDNSYNITAKSYTLANSDDDNTGDEPVTEHTHTDGEWKTITEATCESEGLRQLYCAECGEVIDSASIHKLDHNYDSTKYESTSVDEQGYTQYTCTNCGDTYTEDDGYCLYTSTLVFALSDSEDYYIVTGITDSNEAYISIPSCYNNLPVKEIAKEAFNENKAIKYVTIGKTIEVIGKEAFYNCKALKTVNIPSNLKTFGENCFYWCTALEEIYYSAICANDLLVEDPSGGGYVAAYAFEKAGLDSDGITLYISKEVTRIPQYLFQCNSVNAYINKIIFEEESVCTEIASSAFPKLNNFKEIVLPSSITKLGDNVFGKDNNVIIYFVGTEDEWKNSVLSDNYIATNSEKVYYYSEEKSSGCWHYVDGLPVPW